MEAKCNSNNSWLWKSIINGRDLLKKGIRWEVGNKKKINLREDKWIPTIRGMKIRSNKPINNQIEKLSDVINIQERIWNEAILKEHIAEEEIEEIKRNIFISQNNQENRITWYHDKKDNTRSNLDTT